MGCDLGGLDDTGDDSEKDSYDYGYARENGDWDEAGIDVWSLGLDNNDDYHS